MHRTLKSLVSCAIAVVLLALTVGAQAGTYYVNSTFGSDGNPGTALLPFKSIQKGITAATPGSTLVVAAGTYRESLTWSYKDLVILGSGEGTTIVDPGVKGGGPGGLCLFTQNLTPASRIDGITFQNGNYIVYSGGMYNYSSSPTVTNCTFRNNVSFWGSGGMASYESSLTVTNCSFIGNKSTNGSGAGMANLQSSPTVTNCSFRDNQAAFSGGGLYNYFSSLTVTNCTFSNNSANYGGGLFNVFSSPILTNCTFNNNNSANTAGAMFNEESVPTLVNCILWGNTASLDSPEIYGSANVTYSNVEGGMAGEGNISDDPLFVDAPNGDLRLRPGSPCRNRGNNVVVTSPPFLLVSGVLVDLEGSPRISEGMVDMGAYEVVVSSAPDANAGLDQTHTVPHDGDPATNTVSFTLNGSASSDPDGDTLTYEWMEGTTVLGNAAMLSLNRTTGSYTFILIVTDPSGLSTTDTVHIIINPEPNAAPTTMPQNLSTNQDTSLGITLIGSDPEEDSITYSLASGPAHGTLSGTAPNLTYTPAPGYSGTDSFTFTVQDTYGVVSNTATIRIDVRQTLVDVSGQVQVTRGGFRRNATTGRYTQTVTLKNVGTTILTGPLSLVLDGLSGTVDLYNKTGLTSATSPSGSPYINTGSLVPGASVSLTLEFTNPSNGTLSYTTRVLAGPGTR